MGYGYEAGVERWLGLCEKILGFFPMSKPVPLP